jgi:hypothetical protein
MFNNYIINFKNVFFLKLLQLIFYNKNVFKVKSIFEKKCIKFFNLEYIIISIYFRKLYLKYNWQFIICTLIRTIVFL